MSQFNLVSYGTPDTVSPASETSPLLAIDVVNDLLYVNSGNGWTEVGGSVNSVTGAVVVEAGSSGTIGVTTSGQDIKIDATTATTSQLGVVKPDGTTIDVSSGVISVPTATTGALGLVKPDGTTITISSGVISSSGSSGALTQIAQVSVASAQASVTFSAIPGTYTNLKLTIQARTSNTSTDNILCRFNGDSGSNYDFAALQASNINVSGSGSTGQTSIEIGAATSNSVTGIPGVSEATIFNYAATTFYKSLASFGHFWDTGANGPRTNQMTGDWHNTAAITSIILTMSSGDNFEPGSVVTLYGMQ